MVQKSYVVGIAQKITACICTLTCVALMLPTQLAYAEVAFAEEASTEAAIDEIPAYIEESAVATNTAELANADKTATVPAGYQLSEDAYDAATGEGSAELGQFVLMPQATSWSLQGNTLVISGSGALQDYSASNTAPWYNNRTSITAIRVEPGVTSIGRLAFYDLNRVTSVTLPSSLTSIGEAAFYGCTSLASIALPSSTKTLGVGAFADCTSLASVSGGQITALPDYVFQDTALTTYCIPATCTSVSSIAFYGTALSRVDVDSGNTSFSSQDGVLFSADGSQLIMYPKAKTDASYTIPSTCTTIDQSAFQETAYLASVTIPDSVTDAGMFAFYKSSVKSVTFGAGLSTTSYQMFEACPNLTTINFGGLSTVGDRCFANCPALSTVTLPESVTSIASGAFGNCSSLTNVSTSATSISYQAFLNCSNLSNLELRPGVKTINRAAFLGCYRLAEVTLPTTCAYVHYYAFEEDVNITPLHEHVEKFGPNGYELMNHVSVDADYNYTYAFEILDIVNQRRAEAGASRLYMDADLMQAAMQRAVESAALFSHTRPDGSLCFSASSKMAGENIAFGTATPASAMTLWMNSPGHKANILNSDFTSIGIGCVKINGAYYWTQCFGTNSISANCAKPANSTATTTHINLAAEDFVEATQLKTGTIWEKPEEYHYSYTFSLNPTTILIGETSTATLILTNGASSCPYSIPVHAPLRNDNPNNIRLINANTVQGLRTGIVPVIADLGALPYSALLEVRRFLDVPASAWYAESVDFVADRGIMTGIGGSKFGTGQVLTRAQMAAVLYKYAGQPPQPTTNTTGMKDVANNAWYTTAANWAVSEGVISGYLNADGSRSFKPNTPVTFEQMMTIIANYVDRDGAENTSPAILYTSGLKDPNKVSNWAKPSVAWCYERGLFSGVINPDGTRSINPGEKIKRERAATVVANAIKMGVL